MRMSKMCVLLTLLSALMAAPGFRRRRCRRHRRRLLRAPDESASWARQTRSQEEEAPPLGRHIDCHQTQSGVLRVRKLALVHQSRPSLLCCCVFFFCAR